MLKPIQNGDVATCRPNGIKYVTVNTVLLFDDNKRQMFTQTFELPMLALEVTRANGTVALLTTYTGDNPLAMTRTEFYDEIVEPFGCLVPCALNEPAYGTTSTKLTR